MRILVLGGTGFLGGAIARAALDAGHDVTVMSRGSKSVPAGAKSIIADRMDLPPLPDFDAVLDTCAYAPAMVTSLRAAIGPAHYVVISSISVYDTLPEPGLTEDTDASPATPDDIAMAAGLAPELRGDAMAYGPAYGPLKRSCEDAAGPDATVIRLGLIVGAGDYMDRFTYWVRRIDQGGALPLPGPGDRPTQIIDVRDAAAFALRCAARGISGTYNVTGPARPFGDIIAAIGRATGQTIDLHWHPLSRFTDAGLRPWMDLPLIVPDDADKAHMMNVSIARAIAQGLTFRPLSDTVDNVLTWDRTRRDTALTAGLSPQDEAAVGP